MPNTVNSNFMSALTKLGNAPQGAQVGEFLKVYGHYLDDLKKNARATVGQAIQSTLVGYKNRLRSEDHESIKQNYVDYLPTQKTELGGASPSKNPKPGPGSLVRISGKRYRVSADGDSLEAT